MTEITQDRRSPLLAIKVPFDLSGVMLGMFAWLALVVAGQQGHGFTQGGGGFPPWPVGRPAWLDMLLGGREDVLAARPVTPWLDLVRDPLLLVRAEFVVPLLVLLGVWVVFGVAACRVAALRLARDEGLSAREALVFSIRNIGASVGAVAFVGAAIGLFLGLNALAGLAAGVPLVGIVVFPLSLLGALVLFLLVLGTVFGLPLAFAGLATERNGALDAVSRAFSYVFGRPALFLVSAGTVALFAAVLLAVAWFLPGLALATVKAGAPGGGGALEAFEAAVGTATWFTRPEWRVEGLHLATGWVTWAFVLAFRLALAGWATYYVFGGATAVYFALRHDVDGTEDEELWIEGEDEGLGEPQSPVPPDPGPAPAPPPPADGPAAPTA